jgi:hypothetical protein
MASTQKSKKLQHILQNCFKCNSLRLFPNHELLSEAEAGNRMYLNTDLHHFEFHAGAYRRTLTERTLLDISVFNNGVKSWLVNGQKKSPFCQ